MSEIFEDASEDALLHFKASLLYALGLVEVELSNRKKADELLCEIERQSALGEIE